MKTKKKISLRKEETLVEISQLHRIRGRGDGDLTYAKAHEEPPVSTYVRGQTPTLPLPYTRTV
ncbi:MAG: hypothetical protein R3Y59_09045 [bacterium]